MKYLIVSNGNIANIDIVKELTKKVDYILCADGGIRHLLGAKVLPDLVIGDLDSINEDLRKEIENEGIKFLKYPVNKDKTDTELAVEYAVSNKANEIILIGVTGNRLDHTMANVMLLYKLLKLGIKGSIIDSHNEIYITDSELILEKKENTFISIIPIINDAKGVTLRGFEYETYNIDFEISSTLGISNRIVKDKGYINIKSGVCLVIISKD